MAEGGEETMNITKEEAIELNKELSKTTKEILETEITPAEKEEALKEEQDRVKGKIDKDKYKTIYITPSEIDASLEGKDVVVKGRIVAEQRQKALPRKISWECNSCDKCCEYTVDVLHKQPFLHKGKKSFKGVVADLKNILWKDHPSVVCEKQEEDKEWRPEWFGTIKTYEDYTLLWLNDRLEDQKDLKASAKKIRVSLLGVKPTVGMLVEIEGVVDVDPFTSDLSVIGYGIKEIGATSDNFVLDEQTKKDFDTYFKDKAIENITQIAPDMIGYDLVKQSRLLVLHSPLWIKDLNGKKIRGVLRELLFGDTKTNKSRSIKDNIEKYHLGEYYSAETGSRAGLLYHVDTEKKAISWGILPQNDRGYVGIDAINVLRQEEWSKFKEALEDLKVKVVMAVQGGANIRTRMSTTMNPQKTMSEYLCKCEAIKDTYIFKDKPSITRFDIFLSFSQGDVKDEDVIDRKPIKCPIPTDVFSKHVYWAWGLTENNIKLEKDAIEKIKEETKEIVKKYQTDVIPIVHLATRDTITRLSVSMAILNHSTDDYINVNVRVKDVEMASTFYINMLVELELGLYKGMMEGATHLNNEEMNEIDTEFEIEHYKILRLIVTGPKGSPEIARLLNLSPVTIKRKYETLLKYDLIKTVTGKGVTLTKKGIYFVKKRLNIEKPEKPEKIEIRRDGISFDTMILMKKGVVSFETLNIDNTNNVDNTITITLEDVAKNLGQLIKEYQKKNKEKSFKTIGEKINKIIKEDIIAIKQLKNAENKNVKKDKNKVDTPHLDSIMVSKMIPSTEVEEKLTFFKNNGYSKKIEEIMQRKPKHDWPINDLSFALGFADVKSRKTLGLFLDEITADPKNPTRIRRVGKDKLFWRLIESK